MSEITEEVVEEVIEPVEIVENEPAAEEPEFTSIDDIRTLADGSAEVAPIAEGDVITEPTGEPAWEPDYTYKVKDETMEFPEHLRGSLASKEHEDELRDLYTKAAGLDMYKDKQTELTDMNNGMQTELDELKPQLTQLVDGYRNIKALRESKDFHGLIKTLNWDKEDVLDFAETLLAEEEMPEEQRTSIANERTLRDENELLRHQVQNYETQGSNLQAQEEQSELSAILATEAYAGHAELLKEVGIDIEQEVVALGTQMYQSTRVYPSVGDVVSKVFENRQSLIDRIAPTNVVEEVEPVIQTRRVVERQPTLPKVSGTSSNALDESFSLEKLHEMANAIPNRTY